MCPPARSCSCHPVLLMLLTQTASSPPNFILIGAGLVWQTLPAGWVHTFESHYIRICTRSLLTVSTQLHRSVIYLYVCFQSVSTVAQFQFILHCSVLCALLSKPIEPIDANPMKETLLPAFAGSCSQRSKVADQRCHLLLWHMLPHTSSLRPGKAAYRLVPGSSPA